MYASTCAFFSHGCGEASPLPTRICLRYQPDFHRPEPVRRRKTRRRVIVEQVEGDPLSEPGEDPIQIDDDDDEEEGARPPVQDQDPRNGNGRGIISGGATSTSTSKTRPVQVPCNKKKAGVKRSAPGPPAKAKAKAKAKARTVAVPERPREYLSKVAALVHAGHNGDALLQAVQSESAPVSAPMPAPVEARRHHPHPPRQPPPPCQPPPPLHPVSFPDTTTTAPADEPEPVDHPLRRAPEVVREVSRSRVTGLLAIYLHVFALPSLPYRTRTPAHRPDRVMYRMWL